MALIAQKHGIGGRFARCEAPVRLIALSGDEAAAVARVLRHGENLQQFARAALAAEIARREEAGPPRPRIDPRALIG